MKKDAATLQRPFGWLPYSDSDVKVGVVLQHMDVGHKGALLGVGEGSFLDVLVQLDGSTGRVGNGAGTADALSGFCQGIQAASPVDSYAAPEPSPEPGYTDEVIMASGSFTQGSTIELSCDGPLREPYTCYLQGGLNFAASRAGVLLAVQNAYFKD